MEEERIVGASPYWEIIKSIFYNMGLQVSHKRESSEYISHGVIIIHDDEGLFLLKKYTYEYIGILKGEYCGAKLYHYLRLITNTERKWLLEHPFVQWKRIFPNSNMPGIMYKKLVQLQKYLPDLYNLIPSTSVSPITIPQGRSLGQESSKQTAIRELFEETNITVKEDDLVGPYLTRTRGTDGNTYVTYVYAVFMDKKPSIILGTEFKEYLWISHHENILSSRYNKLLQSFIYELNEFRCSSSIRIQQKGEIGFSENTESPQNLSIEPLPTTTTEKV